MSGDAYQDHINAKRGEWNEEHGYSHLNDPPDDHRKAVAEAIQATTTEATWYLRTYAAADAVLVVTEKDKERAVRAERDRCVQVLRERIDQLRWFNPESIEAWALESAALKIKAGSPEA